MRTLIPTPCAAACAALVAACAAAAFEGRIAVTLTRGGEMSTFLYTAGPDRLRIERMGDAYPIDVVDRCSGALTLVFPHNGSFMRFKAENTNAPAPPAAVLQPVGFRPGMPPMAAPPLPSAGAGISLTPPRPPFAATALAAGAGAPPMLDSKPELVATGQSTNLLGIVCRQYAFDFHGEAVEIWATDRLFPYRPYVSGPPGGACPRTAEALWPELVAGIGQFPLVVRLRQFNGTERLRFEVTAVTTNKVSDPDGRLFTPPSGYREVPPLPF